MYAKKKKKEKITFVMLHTTEDAIFTVLLHNDILHTIRKRKKQRKIKIRENEGTIPGKLIQRYVHRV
jgi:hypothetical protein